MFDRLRRLFRALRGMYGADPQSHETIAFQFEQHARGPLRDQAFLCYGDERFSYAEANRHVNRYASAYRALGLEKGDTVALMMENRPEYLWHYLAAGKLGVVISLINPHNTGKPLAHSLDICKPKLVVVGSEVAAHYAAIAHELTGNAPGYLELDHGASWADYGLLDWATPLSAASDSDPASTAQQCLGDLAAYIYTSGTTGLPKAALVRNQRLYSLGQAVGGLGLALQPGDVMYNCLPLYHTNSIGVCTSSVVTWGATMALARKFSASRFWDDIRKHRATAFIYIGELCRYLMNQPAQPSDRDNPVRAITGNGLRPDIWKRFQERFGIAHIAEFYGSTEGNIGTLNFDNTVGSVGRLVTGRLVKYDDDRDELVRGPNGFLVKCKPGEPGLLIGPINKRTRFDGYQDRAATEQKVIRDAFKKGDAWFNTGDMLRMDWTRRLYFVDRIGDSYRWKGENVSTLEVQEQLSSWPAAAVTNVYGVSVSGTEGRAGMASVVLKDGEAFDPTAFRQHVDSSLPPYARPLFVRVRRELDTTSTFKLKKNVLRDEGFDPHKIADPVYFRDPTSGDYTAMTSQLYEDVVNGRLRL